MPAETLETCPDCARPNFTKRGLGSHRGTKHCKADASLLRHLRKSPVQSQPFLLAAVHAELWQVTIAFHEAIGSPDRRERLSSVLTEKQRLAGIGAAGATISPAARRPVTLANLDAASVEPPPADVVEGLPPSAAKFLETEVLPPVAAGQSIVVPASSLPADDPFARARSYVRGAEMAAKISVAFQALTGLELIAIKKELGYTHGGARNSSAKDSHLTWEDLVKRELGIGKDTARTWMAMADAMKPRLKKLEGGLAALPLLELPPAQWTEEQSGQLTKAVKKLTDGKTQLAFLEELGLAKKPRGAGAKGGHQPGDGETPADTPEQRAIDIWTPILKDLGLEGLDEKSWVHLPDRGPISRETLAGLVRDLSEAMREASAPPARKAKGKGAKH